MTSTRFQYQYQCGHRSSFISKPILMRKWIPHSLHGRCPRATHECAAIVPQISPTTFLKLSNFEIIICSFHCTEYRIQSQKPSIGLGLRQLRLYNLEKNSIASY